MNRMKMTAKHHVVQSPLIVRSNGVKSQPGFLPAGTSLRYLSSFPEGFDRYEIVINVERRPLQLQDLNPPDLVDPLSVLPTEDALGASTSLLHELMRSLGITRVDLVRLLESYQ